MRERSAIGVAALVALVTVLVLVGIAGAFYLGLGPAAMNTASSGSSMQTSKPGQDSSSTATSQAVSGGADSQNATVTTTETVTQTTTFVTTQTDGTTTACIAVPLVNETSTTGQQVTSCGASSDGIHYRVNFAVTPAGAGSTSPSSNTTVGLQAQGLLVQITAAPSAGYSFTSWTATNASIIFGCTTCTTTSAEVSGSGTIVANFAPESGAAYILQTCSSHGLYLQTVSCTLPSPVVEGQTILVEAAVVPQTSVTDSIGNAYDLIAQVGCPCSTTYMLELFSSTASTSGADTITLQGPGNFDGLIVHVLDGVTGVEGTSTGNGTSASPGLEHFQAPSDSFVMGVALINNTEGYFATTANAGQGYSIVTVGPVMADEDSISTGTTSNAQFALGLTEHWAEIAVVFSTGMSSPTTMTNQDMSPAATAAASAPAVLFFLASFCAPSPAAKTGRDGEGSKTALCETAA
jgi:hypothetical protein